MHPTRNKENAIYRIDLHLGNFPNGFLGSRFLELKIARRILTINLLYFQFLHHSKVQFSAIGNNNCNHNKLTKISGVMHSHNKSKYTQFIVKNLSSRNSKIGSGVPTLNALQLNIDVGRYVCTCVEKFEVLSIKRNSAQRKVFKRKEFFRYKL